MLAAFDAERRRQKLTYQQIAERTSLHHNSVSNYVYGIKNPSLAKTRALCSAVGLDLAAVPASTDWRAGIRAEAALRAFARRDDLPPAAYELIDQALADLAPVVSDVAV